MKQYWKQTLAAVIGLLAIGILALTFYRPSAQELTSSPHRQLMAAGQPGTLVPIPPAAVGYVPTSTNDAGAPIVWELGGGITFPDGGFVDGSTGGLVTISDAGFPLATLFGAAQYGHAVEFTDAGIVATYSFPAVTSYLTPGIYTYTPVNTGLALVTAWGGGGGGGAGFAAPSGNASGGGGGGGSISSSQWATVTAGVGVTVVIGGGGAGGLLGGSPGFHGADTTFGTTAFSGASGGQAGIATNTAYGGYSAVGYSDVNIFATSGTPSSINCAACGGFAGAAGAGADGFRNFVRTTGSEAGLGGTFTGAAGGGGGGGEGPLGAGGAGGNGSTTASTGNSGGNAASGSGAGGGGGGSNVNATSTAGTGGNGGGGGMYVYN